MERKGYSRVCAKMFGIPTSQSGALETLSLLVAPQISKWKWSYITMDFLTGVPRIFQGLDTIWVVVDRLTKSAYFLPIQYPMDKLA